MIMRHICQKHCVTLSSAKNKQNALFVARIKLCIVELVLQSQPLETTNL